MICTITDGFDAATVERIQGRLDGVERDPGVRVLWAVESGSRAWGFPTTTAGSSMCTAATTTCHRGIRETSSRLPWTARSTSTGRT